MKRKLLFGSIFLISTLLFSCGDDDDDYAEGPIGFHYQGQSCAQCHSSGEYAFKMGGTVFQIIDAQDGDVNNAAAYHSVRLILEDGTIALSKANIGAGTGNFWANPNIPDGVKYKVEVLDRNGNVVNETNGYTHSNTRFDCNRCHTAQGTDGAPGRIVNYFYNQMNPEDNTQVDNQLTSFSADVYPILETKCQSCHNPTGSASNTGLVFANANEAYIAIIQNQPSTQGYNSFIDTNTPQNSLLLLKATNSVSHSGGQIFAENSVEYNTILNWINQGAPNN